MKGLLVLLLSVHWYSSIERDEWGGRQRLPLKHKHTLSEHSGNLFFYNFFEKGGRGDVAVNLG